MACEGVGAPSSRCLSAPGCCVRSYSLMSHSFPARSAPGGRPGEAVQSTSSQGPARLTHRLPWLGVLVVRLGCQGNLTLSPFG